MKNEFIYDFISKNKLGVLSTVTPEGLPHSALVGIAVTKNLELLFDTVEASRKFRNLSNNNHITFVIGWDDETTIQYEGVAELLSGNELREMKKIYFEVFPDGPEREKWPGITYYKVKPKWIRYSDFSEKESQIEEKGFN